MLCRTCIFSRVVNNEQTNESEWACGVTPISDEGERTFFPINPDHPMCSRCDLPPEPVDIEFDLKPLVEALAGYDGVTSQLEKLSNTVGTIDLSHD